MRGYMLDNENRSMPNIIFVLADQLRYRSCGYAGDKNAHTPNPDKLAVSGACPFHPIDRLKIYRPSPFILEIIPG